MDESELTRGQDEECDIKPTHMGTSTGTYICNKICARDQIIRPRGRALFQYAREQIVYGYVILYSPFG